MSDIPESVRAEIDGATAELLRLARDARAAMQESDVRRLAALHARVRDRAEVASGATRALYEVAESFLRAMSRQGFGRDVLTVLDVIDRHKLAAASLFDRASSNDPPARADVAAVLAADVDELLRRGVLEETGGRLAIRPGLRSVVRDIVEPPLFRMWRHVQQMRASTALSSKVRGKTSDAEILASALGVTLAQAQFHLAQFPITAAVREARQQRGPTLVRPGVFRKRVSAVVDTSDASVRASDFQSFTTVAAFNDRRTSNSLSRAALDDASVVAN